MRILVVTNMFPAPRTPTEGVFIADQVESLRARGHAVEVLHLERTQGGPAVYRRLARELRSAVGQHDPDVVHAMYGGLLAHEVVRAVRGRPVVVSFCGSDLLGEPTSPPLARLAARAGVVASRRAARGADAVVVKSPNLLDRLPQPLRASTRVHVVPNGVALDRFRPEDPEACRASLGWTGQGPHVVFAGQPRPIKRPELARAAVDLLRGRLPAAELHVPDGVAHDSMPLWLNAADVVLLTSRHEGSPNIIKEALACGARVVSVPVGDVPERLAGVAGAAVVPSDDPEAIAAAVAEVLARPRPAGPPASITPLSVQAQAERLERIYREAVDRARARRGAEQPASRGAPRGR